MRAPNTPTTQSVDLGGFRETLANPPTDKKKYMEARTQLLNQIYARRQKWIEELKRTNEDLNRRKK